MTLRRLRQMPAAVFVPLALYQAHLPGPWPSQTTIRVAADGVADCSAGEDFNVQVAQTPEQQAAGLMNRHEPLGSNEGMLFVWDQAAPQAFWMKDTYVPLTLLYFGPDSSLIGALEMPVEAIPNVPTVLYPSGSPALAALEIAGGNAGRFGGDEGLCIKTSY
jgi:uncharacterized membrane protein (UPF0127 family)